MLHFSSFAYGKIGVEKKRWDPLASQPFFGLIALLIYCLWSKNSNLFASFFSPTNASVLLTLLLALFPGLDKQSITPLDGTLY